MKKERHYPHRFLYVGRLSWQKSIPLLISAWKDIQEKNTDWELVLIGNGNLKDSAEGYKNIKILNWLQPEDLHEEIKKSGCFIVPSHWEPWAVTVHEFCAAGMPMILSDKIGARTTFLIDNHNGYTFESKNLESLKNALLKVINDSDKNLFQMGKHSHEISKRLLLKYQQLHYFHALKINKKSIFYLKRISAINLILPNAVSMIF